MAAQTVSELMNANPVTMSADTSTLEAAQAMRDAHIGDIIVTEGDRAAGVVTDRDLVVRVLADQRDPGSTRVRDVCSGDLVTIRPDTPVEEAVRLMRERAIRRLPVVDDDGRPVGAVSIGDLAVERDPGSALADISAAPPNR